MAVTTARKKRDRGQPSWISLLQPGRYAGPDLRVEDKTQGPTEVLDPEL